MSPAGHAPVKALVVEDTATSLALVCHLLERMGITPVPARDGLNGITLFEKERPDLILLDIVLPGIDGIDVARRIRGLEKPGDWTPIIFLSGHTRDEDLEQGVAAGGDDYIFKPVSECLPPRCAPCSASCRCATRCWCLQASWMPPTAS